MSECTCNVCQSACENKPGWLLPGEAEKIAKFLNLDLQECFNKYLGVDWYERSEGNIFLLAPAITSMTPGEEYPGDPRGRCIFYKEGRCGVHDVKPHGCAEYIHTLTRQEVYAIRDNIVKAWGSNQSQITELLGSEPESEEFDGGAMSLFGGIF
jgi:Fe-S-cluster containining protein